MELIFNVIAIKNNIGYASDFERNGLFEVDIATGECKFVKMFPNEEIMITRLHDYAEWIENRIYFIPAAGKHISVFNTETEEIGTIEIPQFSKKENNNYNPKLKFIKAIEYNKYLWLIPATYPGILRLNIDTKEVKLINSWIPENGYMFRRGVRARKNKIYAASGINNNVLIFDMDLESGDVIKVGKTNNGIMDMCECGEDFIMAPRKNGGVIRWNPESKIVDEYDKYPKEFEAGEIVFQYIYEFDSQIILVPAHASHGIRFKKENLFIDNDITWKNSRDNKISLIYEHENRVYFREYLGNSSIRFFYIEKNNNNLALCQFNVINFDERLKAIKKSAAENHEVIVIKETSAFGLKEWIKSIV